MTEVNIIPTLSYENPLNNPRDSINFEEGVATASFATGLKDE
jgi:hypothetical protein